MRFFIFILFATCLLKGRSQSFSGTDTVGKQSTSENIYSKAFFSDSLSSSFCIVIKKEVKAHKHISHSEQVVVLEGEGLMKLGENTFTIKSGDVIHIPKNMVHSVKTTSKIPLKVLSIQAPYFNGSDRVFVEEK